MTKVVVHNIRCFERAELDLSGPGGTKMWAVITGDNGVGKTTFLRCIAMGLCDKDSAAGLLRDTYGQWIRKGQKKGSIKIELRQGKTGKKPYRITTRFYKSERGLEGVDRQRTIPAQDMFPWQKIFVCGYGANRRPEGSLDYDMYKPADAVYTLFDYDCALQGPEIVMRRLIMAEEEHQKEKQKEVCGWLDNVFMLPQGSTSLTKAGIALSGEWGKDIHLGALGDGYEGTLTWLMDLLGWAMLVGEGKRGSKLRGIVLIDELEQYLHPRWQREIISRLHEQFPKLQFIATTHSPVCAAGTADVPDNGAKLALLKRMEDERVTLVDDLPSLGGWRADQVLASEVFGYLVRANIATEEMLRKASILAGKGDKRTAAEDARYRKLKEEVHKVLIPSGETLIEREMQSEFHEDVRRQIAALERELFGGGNDQD